MGWYNNNNNNSHGFDVCKYIQGAAVVGLQRELMNFPKKTIVAIVVAFARWPID